MKIKLTINNEYEVIDDATVKDHATGLMWQQSGTCGLPISFLDVPAYINSLNTSRLGGYSDWRLPTLEELITLLEPHENENEMFIDPIFDKRQHWCWSDSGIWVVNFNTGHVSSFVSYPAFVRVCRSMKLYKNKKSIDEIPAIHTSIEMGESAFRWKSRTTFGHFLILLTVISTFLYMVFWKYHI